MILHSQQRLGVLINGQFRLDHLLCQVQILQNLHDPLVLIFYLGNLGQLLLVHIIKLLVKGVLDSVDGILTNSAKKKKITDKKSGLGKPILITWIFFFTDFNKYFLTILKSIEVYPSKLWLDPLPLEEWSGSFSGPGCVSQTGCRRGRFLRHTWHLLTKHKTCQKLVSFDTVQQVFNKDI